MEFEWGEDKRQTNIDKHGVDFTDAIHVFFDSNALDEEDTRDFGEQRYRTIGITKEGIVLFVAYTWRGSTIRIISARRANRNERSKYYSN
jgi:hypothetical protein